MSGLRREGYFAGQDGLRIFWQAWLPEEPRAALLVAHGYGEHGGRYANVVDFFVPRGYAVYALDHRGHGRSDGPRGHVGRFTQYVADFHAFRVRAEEEQKGKPLVLLGHSMGGLIAIHYLLSHGQGLAAAVLSSPALGIRKPPPKWMQWVGRVLSWVAPRTSFHGNVDPRDLSRDASVGEAYASDPLVHRRASARFFTEFQSAIASALERAPEIRLPVLVLQAGDDRLVDVAATERFTAALGSENKRLVVYPGLFHELFNETEKERVLLEAVTWVDARLPEH